MEVDTHVETLHDNLVEAEVHTLGDRLSDVKYEDQGTNGHVGRHSRRALSQNTSRNVEAETLVDTLAD